MTRESPPPDWDTPAPPSHGSASAPAASHTRADPTQQTLPQIVNRKRRPLWVMWFAHPFANWFWFYFGFVAALSGSSIESPGLGPIVIIGWLSGHLVNSKQPTAEVKLLMASAGLGYVCDGFLTLVGVLKFRESYWWGWPQPLWMVMMWPNFAGTLNSSMRWLQGHFRLGAVLGAIAGPFSYYGGQQWGAVQFGVPFLVAMIIIGIEWTFGMTALLWLAARWIKREPK